jgi:hypothetical protein
MIGNLGGYRGAIFYTAFVDALGLLLP